MADVLIALLKSLDLSQATEILTKSIANSDRNVRDPALVESSKTILLALKGKGNVGESLVGKLLREICLPFLYDTEFISGDKARQSLPQVYDLIALCCSIYPDTFLDEVCEKCSQAIAVLVEGKSRENIEQTGAFLDVSVALDLMSYLVTWKGQGKQRLLTDELEEAMFVLVVRLLPHTGEALCAKLTSGILPGFLRRKNERIEVLWNVVQEISKRESGSVDQSTVAFHKSYAILCGLADFFFASDAGGIYRDREFWEVIQKGIVLMEPLALRRTVFLLKKAVNLVKQQSQKVDVQGDGRDPIFRWDPAKEEEFLSVWQEYILLIEILNEKQVHLISPVLPRVAHLVAKTEKSAGGLPTLDVSWIMTLYHHASHHENRFIQKWAAVSFLTLDLQKSPILEPTRWGFLFGPLLGMLKRFSIYSRGEEAVRGDALPVGQAVVQFFSRFVNALPDEQCSTFLCQLLCGIEKAGFEEVPLLFLTQALSQVAPCSAWDGHALSNVKQIMAQVYTHNLHLRSCLQCFLLKALVNLTDTGKVSWSEVENVLTADYLGESLQRGTPVWTQVCDLFWRIQSDQSSASLSDYLKMNIDQLLRGESAEQSAGNPRMQALVRMLLFAADAHFSFASDSGSPLSPIVDIFQQLVGTVQKASTHVYTSEKRVLNASLLLAQLLEHLGSPNTSHGDPTASVVMSIVSSSCQEILSSLLRKLMLSGQERCDLHSGRVYLQLAEQMFRLIVAGSESNLCSEHFSGFWRELIDQAGANALRDGLQHHDLSLGEWSSLVLATKCLALVCHCVMSRRSHFQGAFIQSLVQTVSQLSLRCEFRKPAAVLGSTDACAVTSVNWNAVVLDATETQWTCMEFLLHESLGGPHEGPLGTSSKCPNHLLPAALQALSVAPQKAALPILRCIGRVVPVVVQDEGLVVSAVDGVWRAFQNRKRRDLKWFWETLHETTAVLFSAPLLSLPRSHPVTSLIRDDWQELLEFGEDRPGIVNQVVAQCCELWSGALGADSAARVHSFSVHTDLVVDALLFGPQFRKAQYVINDVIEYLRCLDDESIRVALKYHLLRRDVQPRVDVINALMSLDPRDMNHVTFLRDLIRLLVKKDAEMSQETPRYSLNSRRHRRKQRLWQTVLVLLPRVVAADGNEEFAAELVQAAFDALSFSNQTSVRVLLEWTLVVTLGRFPCLHQLLWQQMVSSKRSGSLTSLITVATLVGQYCFEDPSAQATYLCSALSAILPWSLSTHVQTRLYAQVAVQKIWKFCRESQPLDRVLREHAILEPCVAFMRDNAQGYRQKSRLEQNFFLFDVDPWGDHTMESVFQVVPRLTGASDDEWISPEVFIQDPHGMRVWNTAQDPHRIPLYNRENSRLAQVTRVPRIGAQAGINKHLAHRMAGVNTDQANAHDAKGGGDVQQKITPWSLLPPAPEAERDAQRLLTQHKSLAGNLVVVASLIDRAPNLGGLCRTCEVFGAQTLVLGNRQVVDDMQFKSLSVSAGKWVNIEEVKPAALKSYLEDMRHRGYTLIGVEQTANSVNLTQYQFPQKSLLLLGHEKEGIPVEFIHLLDQCVEIPQVGVIRSLNVHVSGALLIWEYTRQRVLSKEAPAGRGTAAD